MLKQAVESYDNNLHVLGISECWLTSKIPDSFENIDNFTCIRNDRDWGNIDTPNHIKKKGGGVCLYLNSKINWSTVIYV